MAPSHHWYTGAWQPAGSFGSCTMLAPAIASWGSGKLDAFRRGCAPWYWEGVFHKSYNGSSWSAWTDRGGCLASAPGTDAWAPDWLDVPYRGCDSIYNLYWNGGAWAHAFFSPDPSGHTPLILDTLRHPYDKIFWQASHTGASPLDTEDPPNPAEPPSPRSLPPCQRLAVPARLTARMSADFQPY